LPLERLELLTAELDHDPARLDRDHAPPRSPLLAN
jgi:hypothetical protein